ncbi:MAG TPA: hypothetical protein VIF09_21860, partial [Polyangiaceae bacterium]
TGEERIREHLDILYGAFTGWEGKPTRYQVDRIDVLRKELTEVGTEVERIVTSDVKPLDGELRNRRLEPIPTTADAADVEEEQHAGDAPVLAAVVRCVQSRGASCEDAARAAKARASRGEKD